MIDLTKLYFFIFGALTIAGGVMGFVKAGSKASLIAGGVSGLLLVLAGYLLASGREKPGLILGVLVSIALVGRFGPGFLNSHKFMPAGLMAVLSLGGILMTVLAFVKK